MKKVSIISPVFENVNRISETVTGLIEFFKDKYEFEVFYYHSIDLPENLMTDARFIYTKVDKNISHDDCVLDGFEKASGNCVIVADLNNVEYKDYLLKLLVEWESKAQIVFVKRDKKSFNFWQKIGNFFAEIGRKIGNMFLGFAGLSKKFGAENSFQLFASNVVELIKQFPEKNYYLRNFDCWVDFRVSVIYTKSKLSVKRRQKKSTGSLWGFIVSTLLFGGLLTAIILTNKLITEANRSMFFIVGTGLLVVFGLFGIFNLYRYVIYRMTNLKSQKK